MKRHLIAALLIACFALSGSPVFAADMMLAPFKKSDGKWGFVNSDHCWVINPQFERAVSFSDGLAKVQLGYKSGFIDRTGKMVINPQFDSAYGFKDGLATVKLGGKDFQINRAGQVLLDPTCTAKP